eukprot:755430-Alexandrium_andersonii.AAC.1
MGPLMTAIETGPSVRTVSRRAAKHLVSTPHGQRKMPNRAPVLCSSPKMKRLLHRTRYPPRLGDPAITTGDRQLAANAFVL